MPRDVINAANAGVTVHTAEQVKTTLESWINNFFSGRPMEPTITNEMRAKLSWEATAKELGKLLDMVTGANHD